MALETPLLHLGWLTLSTLDDARSTVGSINSGALTALNGPNGSGQFYWVYMSSLKDLQVRLGSSLATITSTNTVVGILQNKPGPGEAADVGFFGVSKAICASTTSIVAGSPLMPSSAPVGQSGGLSFWSSGSMGSAIGYALETPASTGALFTVMLNPTGIRTS